MVKRLTTTNTSTTMKPKPAASRSTNEKMNLVDIIAQQREAILKYDREKEEKKRQSLMMSSSFQYQQQGKEDETTSATKNHDKLFSQPIPRKEQQHQSLRVINFTPRSEVATHNDDNSTRQRCQKRPANDQDDCRYETRKNEIYHQLILPKENPKSSHQGRIVKQENANGNGNEINGETSNSSFFPTRNASPFVSDDPPQTNSSPRSTRNLWSNVNQYLHSSSSSSIHTSPSNEKSTLKTIQLPTTTTTTTSTSTTMNNHDQAAAASRKKCRLEDKNNVIEYNNTILLELRSSSSSNSNESNNVSKEEMNHVEEELYSSDSSKSTLLSDVEINCIVPFIPPIPSTTTTNNQGQEKVIQSHDHLPIQMNTKQELVNFQSTLSTTLEEETKVNMNEPFFVKILFIRRRTHPSEVLVNELIPSYSKFADEHCSILGFLSLERSKLSGYTFARLRQGIKEDLVDDDDEEEEEQGNSNSSSIFLSSSSNRSWRFYIPELGPVSLKQERKFGDIFKFLINIFGATEVGDGSPFNAFKVMIVDI